MGSQEERTKLSCLLQGRVCFDHIDCVRGGDVWNCSTELRLRYSKML